MKHRIDQLKNFGFVDEVTVTSPGINGKLNELQAAIGLLQLRDFDTVIRKRQAIDKAYRQGLSSVPGIRCPLEPDSGKGNFSYFPILVEPEYALTRDQLYDFMKSHGIHCRRYFFPLISAFPMYRGLPSSGHASLPVAERVSQQVLCLPIYPDLPESIIARITELISASNLISR
jgi:dTDP-4-amino-4,6-dideoxygalactose transaminase